MSQFIAPNRLPRLRTTPQFAPLSPGWAPVDIATVARSVADSVRPLLESRSFPDSFVEPGSATQPLDFSKAAKLEIESLPMMAEATLVVKNGTDILFEGQFQRSVAQVIIKALLLGRRKFSFPVDVDAAESTLKEFAKWFPKIIDKIATGCGMSAVGTSYEERVHTAALEVLHLDPKILEPEFFGTLRIHN